MAKSLNELLKKVNPDVVQAAKERAEQEILEMRLSMLREQLELSQVEMAQRLGISQPSVANLEKRGQEIKLSSLKRYVEAMGGKLTLDVQLPDGRHIGMNF
ncbi:helix-turn-helix domain-containing protein [Plesiomonas shigelloides]|uniref:helix-turn-helix domain-containing protein n=1 Tax=Plesiomonas shigelloides TaxID=703 RepID=UPI001261B9A6|nr:helix-turn-helix domain-containing protein [Plesiomonas shigelloides]KAB7697140.1 helix-turn-helix domain-containing protein [Plesiomonas shigelloides]